MDSVKTALKVFELVATLGEAGVSELARQTGEPKSTIQRGLVTLHEAGWLRPVGEGARRRWSPTAKLLILSRQFDPLPDLRQLAMEAMEDLCSETRETIHLVLREGHEIVLVDRVDSPQILRTVRPLGARAPLHVVSTGKAILADMSPAEQERYVAGGLQAWTERSIGAANLLADDLKLIRERGFALSDGELDIGIRSVGAAIRGPDGQPIAALSISCPASRLPDSLIDRYGRLVNGAAGRVQVQLQEVAAQRAP